MINVLLHQQEWQIKEGYKMRIEYDVKLDFADVLIRPKRSTLHSRAEVTLDREFRFRHAKTTWRGVPIIAANMDHTGTFAMAKVLQEHHLLTAIDKFMGPKDWAAMAKENPTTLSSCFYSLGITEHDIAKLHEVMKHIPVPMICLDVANGYTERFVSCLEHLRETYPDKVIMAGNVVTGEMVEELILSGADIVKIGIGPGSVCTTREKTGVGYPQLSAIIECADAAHGLSGQVCADGGCVTPGDVAKAFSAGADVGEHRPPADRMQHLRKIRLHAAADARRQHDRLQVSHRFAILMSRSSRENWGARSRTWT